MLRKLIISLIAITLYATSWSQEPPPPGVIEGIFYNPQFNNLQISGSSKEDDFTESNVVFEAHARGQAGTISKKTIENGKFNIEVAFNAPFPGGLTEIQLTANFPNGKRTQFLTNDGRTGLFHVPKTYARHWILLGITLIFILLAYTQKIRKLGNYIANWVQIHPKKVSACIIFLFFTLVLIGVTGSSLRIVLEGPVAQAISTVTGSDSRIFKPQYSRGDEWGILTPNVLAQVHHNPKFPIINKNLGIEGQNMGVLGMTGVPIAQWSAIARPATWGYFFLPLRQAQSWQWQLPFWGCLAVLWWLLNILKPSSIGRNLALSTLFCVAPYAAAWSNWPLYFTLFPALAFACFIKLCKARNITQSLLWGIGIGYALAAWILTLYPPWMVSIGTLCALLCAGWLMDQRSTLKISFAMVTGIFASLLTVAAILGSWWTDTKDAIELMQSTVYPGQRTTLTGGNSNLLWTFRGYTNAETITLSRDGPWANQPEISSYIWLPFAIGWLCISGLFNERKNRFLVLGCSIFVLFYFIFAFIGIPEWLAKISQWGRVPTNRTDVSLGLAFVVLLSLMRQEWFSQYSSAATSINYKILMTITTIGSLWLAYFVLSTMPVFAFPKNSVIYITSFMIFITFCVWWLIQGKTAGPIALLFVYFLTASLGFNPIAKAPKSIDLLPEVRALASDENGHLQRTLFVSGEGMGPHFLAAVGLPVVNGVLAYPHRTLWERLDLPEKDWPIVNRYQHLAFKSGAPTNGRSYSVSSPWMEWVVVTIDPQVFDFSLTGAQRIAAFEDQAIHLRKSPMLKEIGSHQNLKWFSIIPPSPK